MVNKFETMEELKEAVGTAVKEKAGSIPDNSKQLIEETVVRMLKDNLTLGDALEISPDLMEEMYDYGYRLYNSGKYKDALAVFEMLRNLDGTDSRFTFAIAASQHLSKDYTLAAGNYMLYEVLEPKDPLAYYHLFDCFTKMGQPMLAFDALSLASRLAQEGEEHAALRGKIDIELNRLKELQE